MPTTVVNIYDASRPAHDVCIMRPGRWGNPFHVRAGITREEAIKSYRKWLLSRSDLIAAARRELRGKVLGCCCKPLACHGDVIAEIVDKED
jgi:hypothetical protein